MYNYPLHSLCSTINFFFGRNSPQWARTSSFTRFPYHTQRRTTVGWTPLDEWSARRRDIYLTTHNTHNRKTSMPPVGFETTIPVGERPQTYALERAATGTGQQLICLQNNNNNNLHHHFVQCHSHTHTHTQNTTLVYVCDMFWEVNISLISTTWMNHLIECELPFFILYW